MVATLDLSVIKNVYFDPLEQFGVVLTNYVICPEVFPSTSLIFIGIFLIIFYFLFIVGTSVKAFYASIAGYISLDLLVYVASMLKQNVLIKKNKFLMFYLGIFLIIFFSNFLGMVPFSVTLTSYSSFTFFMAAGSFLVVNIIGIFYKKSTIWNVFLPGGIPLALTFLLIPIEVLSYFAKMGSLGIRLFANMLAGHALLKILGSFAWTLLFMGMSAIIGTIVISIVLVLISFLEFIIAGLQAYVFLVLSSIYLNDTINDH